MQGSRVVSNVLGIAIWFALLGAAEAQLIETVAGGGPDNLPAILANLDLPISVAADSDGNVFIAARALHRVFKVDATGHMTVAAGNGTGGFGGDGSLATAASLLSPEGVALDAVGNLFIADRLNYRIRRVEAATGIITTIAGNGTRGFNGDGGLATDANLNDPSAVALDAAGNLFFADQVNQRIRRVDAVTRIITTFAGNGTRGFSGDGGPATSAAFYFPRGIALDGAGNLFIVDVSNKRVRRVDAVTGVVTTYAGNGFAGPLGDGGPATSAGLRDPSDVALDAAGNLFISDRYRRIRRVDAATRIITTYAGNGSSGSTGDGGPATGARLRTPDGAALDAAGNLFIADGTSRNIRRVDAATGIITTIAGNGTATFSGDGYPATSASFGEPSSAAVDAEGNLFIADTLNHRIRRVDVATGIIFTVAGNGNVGFSGDGGPATNATMNKPSGVALDAAGNLFIADTLNDSIRRVDAATGIITTVVGNGFSGFAGDGGPASGGRLNEPLAIAFDPTGNLFIADQFNRRVRRVDAATGIITTYAGGGSFGSIGDGGPATDAFLRNPMGVALDAAGNLAISESFNLRIRYVDVATGIITTVAGNGSFGFSGDGGLATNARLAGPRGVVFGTEGDLYLADLSNQRIRQVERATALIATVAGNGCKGSPLFGPSEGCFGGDGGVPADASLSRPVGVALDAASNLLIADTGNNRIRRVRLILKPEINIKPGSELNSINPSLEGDLPVAVLGSDTFDVADVDATTLAFGPSYASFDHSQGPHFDDLNGDGFTDLLAHYRAAETGIEFGDMKACVTGEMLDGTAFEGCDAIRTVPDMDGDALLDAEEAAIGTDALNPDTDGDGFTDGQEVLLMGTDPLDPLDPEPTPVPEPASWLMLIGGIGLLGVLYRRRR